MDDGVIILEAGEATADGPKPGTEDAPSGDASEKPSDKPEGGSDEQ